MDRSLFYARLDAFTKTLETQLNADVAKRHKILQDNAIAEGRRGYHEVGIDDTGKRFVRVWEFNGSQRCVKYFVEKETGTIFGAKGWKAYNPARSYGTLETIMEWDWSGYYAESKKGQGTLVPKADRR